MLAFQLSTVLILQMVDESICSMVLSLFNLCFIRVNVPLPNSPLCPVLPSLPVLPDLPVIPVAPVGPVAPLLPV